MPDVTVLMAVHNGDAYLRPAIDSVLAQTYRDFEFLIVNDGSTDSTDAICRSYPDPRVRVITLAANQGLSAALNIGLAETRTALVARLDADDVAAPERLARQRDIMVARPELALVGGQAVAMTPDGTAIGTVRRPLEPASILWASLFDNPFAHPTVMFRTAVVRDELGGFCADYDPFAQDYDLWCRVMERHPVANIPDRLIRYRAHGASIMGVLEGGPAQSYSHRFTEIARTLLMRQARRLFDTDTLSDDDLHLIPGLVLGFRRDDVRRFLDLFERLLREFRERGHATASRDFALTLARQFDALALRVTPHARGASAHIYAHAVRRHPEIVRYVSWPRAAALVLFGSRGRGLVADWTRRYLPGAVD
jgi:glycosyltransferase involved in cell wall biosynthesis